MPAPIEIIAAIDRQADPRPADLGELVAHVGTLPEARVLRHTGRFVTFVMNEDGIEPLRERFRGRFVLEPNLALRAPAPVDGRAEGPGHGTPSAHAEGRAENRAENRDDPDEIREF